MSKSKLTNADNQDEKYQDSQESSYDDSQDSSYVDDQGFADDGEGIAAPTTAQKLQIVVKLGKAGYEATIPTMPEVKKKVSKISLEKAALDLVNSMKQFAWEDWKDVTSYRDQGAGRKTYEYTGEPF